MPHLIKPAFERGKEFKAERPDLKSLIILKVVQTCAHGWIIRNVTLPTGQVLSHQETGMNNLRIFRMVYFVIKNWVGVPIIPSILCLKVTV